MKVYISKHSEIFMAEKEKKEKEEKVVKEEEKTKLTDLPGIGPAVASKLEAAGIYDLMGLAVMSDRKSVV